VEGDLACSHCAARYPVTHGVPRLLPRALAEEAVATARRFGYEWTRFSEIRPEYEEQMLGWIAPVGREAFVGRRVLDAGCGKGRHLRLAAAFGAKDVIGIDLGRGQFRRPFTDQELAGIIRNGIPDTPMPPANVSEAQAVRIVAYLRSLAESKRSVGADGDLARGRAVFLGKGACSTCHRVHGEGSRLGPDLSRIGGLRRAVELEQSVLDPQREVLPTNRFYRVTTRDGASVTGRLLNHDTFTVQLLDSDERLRSFVKSEVREHGFADTPMPSYRGRLDAQEVADVISYLVSLKGRTAP